MLRITSISDLAQVSARIELLKEIFRNQQWQRAVDHYTPLRKLLIDIKGRLPKEEKIELDSILTHAIEQLLIIEIESSEAIARGTEIDSARFQSMLLKIQNDIDKAQAELEQEMATAS